jgi:hypothetical protein|tara:strand:- start:298 stop:1275 length:978 start_codon:yes stop_codon:yes gene_type:complete
MFKVDTISVKSIDLKLPCGMGDAGYITYTTDYKKLEVKEDLEFKKFLEGNKNLTDDYSDSESEEENLETYELKNNTKAREISNTLIKDNNGDYDITDINNIKILLKWNKKKNAPKLEYFKFWKNLPEKYKFNVNNFPQELLNRLRNGLITPEDYIKILFDCDITIKSKEYIIVLEYSDDITDGKFHIGELEDYKKTYIFRGEQKYIFDYGLHSITLRTNMINGKLYENWFHDPNCWLNNNLPFQIVSCPKKRVYCFLSREYNYINGVYLESNIIFSKHEFHKLVNSPDSVGFNFKKYNHIIKEKKRELETDGYTCINDDNDIIVF